MHNPPNRNHLLLTTCLLGSLALTGCDRDASDPEALEDLVLRDSRSEVDTPDDPDGGIWVNNGLEDPSVSGIDPTEALSSEAGLSSTSPLLLDPSRRPLVQYLVECALRPDQTISRVIDGVDTDFHGMIGLAEEWADGECDEDCQQWVSACLLARTNVSGQTVSLWMRADHPAIGSGTSLHYPVYEASFFGNLFAGPEERYICQGSAASEVVAFLDGRTCSNGLSESCGFTKYTDCELAERCTFSGLLTPMGIGCTPEGDQPHHTITTYVSALP